MKPVSFSATGKGPHVSILGQIIPFIDVLESMSLPWSAFAEKAALPVEIDPLQLVESRQIVRFVYQVAYSE